MDGVMRGPRLDHFEQLHFLRDYPYVDDRMTEEKRTMPTSKRDRSPGASQEEAFRRKMKRLPRKFKEGMRAVLEEAFRQKLDIHELVGSVARDIELTDGKSVAVHEAGHAVVALAVGFRVLHLEVGGSAARAGRACMTPPLWMPRQFSAKRTVCWFTEAHVAFAYAGCEAQRMLWKHEVPVSAIEAQDLADVDGALSYYRHWGTFDEDLLRTRNRTRARDIVRREREAVLGLADALLAQPPTRGTRRLNRSAILKVVVPLASTAMKRQIRKANAPTA
jgi:hypothetical protein